MSDLTDRQRQILGWIVDSFRERHRAPTYRELLARMGRRSPNAVCGHLKALQAKGFIRVQFAKAHGIELVGHVPCPHCAGLGTVPSELVNESEATAL